MLSFGHPTARCKTWVRLPGGGGSGAPGISICGQVAGQSDLAGSGGKTHAFVWSNGSGMQDLGTLAGDNVSLAVAVNACGQAVGNSTQSAGGKLRAFIWTKGTGHSDVGTLPGFTDAGAHDINNLGQVVGYCAVAGSANRGFCWSSIGGMRPVGTLPGGLGSDAVGINDLGEIVGSSDSGDVNNAHAVLWNRTGVAEDLGTLAGGTWSAAFAVNIFGTVVGNGNCTGSPSHAFAWNKKDAMQDLNALIPANSGWVLQGAVAVSVAGQIVGVGTVNGQQHAFLLTPQYAW
jgi:probable HAF family extracellular repeat protein